MQDTRKDIVAYADPLYRPYPKPAETPLQAFPRKLTDLDIDALEQDINTNFEEIPHIMRV